MSECRMCKERGKTWSGSDPMCAFSDGEEFGENWNCATMNALRGISMSGKPGTWHWRDDSCSASFGVIWIRDESDVEDAYGYLAMTWYKQRGRTGRACVMCDESAPRPLTLDVAEAIIEMYADTKTCA